MYRLTSTDSIPEVWVAGTTITGSQGRLDYATSIVEERRTALAAEGTTARYIGSPFRVNVSGAVGQLLADNECRAALELIARHGDRTGVVILWHGHLGTITRELATWSGALVAALAEGRSCRHVESLAPILDGPPGAFGAASALLSACLSMIAVDDPAAIAACIAETAGSDRVRRAMAASLRSAADLLDPDTAVFSWEDHRGADGQGRVAS